VKAVRYDDGYSSQPQSSGSVSGGGGGGGGSSNAELQKRVLLLEDQIKLLKQQNRIFLSFMQNTEQQLAELRSQPPTPSADRARSRNGGSGGGSDAGQAGAPYPNNMSQATKQVLQRSHSERHTQQQPGSARAGAAAAAAAQQAGGQSPSMGPLGGRNEVDQSFAPLDEDDAARRERLRSAKKKKELLNLRSKMKGQGVPPPSQSPPLEEDASRGRGYTADNYADAGGYGGGGGYGQQQQQPAARGRAPSAQAGGNNQQQPRRAAPPSEYPEDDDRGFGGGGGGGGGFGNDSFTGGGGGIPEGADEVVETFPCPKCDRRFNAVALQKHIAKQICQQKPRKVFNMAAQRLEELAKEAREAGVKLNPVVPGAPPGGGAAAPAAAKGDNRPAVGKKGAKWRQDHEKFLAAIKAGRQTAAAIAAGVPLSSLPPPPPAREEDDTRTGCPHWFVHISEQCALETYSFFSLPLLLTCFLLLCVLFAFVSSGRKFEQTVAERHIPHCKNTKAKPKATTASIARLGSTAAGAAAAAAAATNSFTGRRR
jgi:hypothetical protein